MNSSSSESHAVAVVAVSQSGRTAIISDGDRVLRVRLPQPRSFLLRLLKRWAVRLGTYLTKWGVRQ
jgi:hypothetical protein